MDFEVEISTFQKSPKIGSRQVGRSKTMFRGPVSGLEPIWTIWNTLEAILTKKFDFFSTFFQLVIDMLELNLFFLYCIRIMRDKVDNLRVITLEMRNFEFTLET